MARNTEQIASLFAAVGFKVDRKSLKDVETSLKGIEDKLSRIRAGFMKVKANQSVNRMFSNMGKNAEGASKGVDKLTSSVKRGESPILAYTGAINALAGAMAGLRASMAGVALPRVPAASGGFGGGSRGGGAVQGGFFSGAFAGLFGGGASSFARGLIPGLGAGWAVAHATTKAREMIATENAFGALTGSQAGGRQEMRYLREFSDTYGLKMSESADGFKRILASSVGTKLQGQGAKEIFEGTSLYGKTLGLSNENMSRATTAISQMISKGKISSEELKGQLAEAIPGAVQIFAKAMDVPVAQMFKMMENGEVLAEDVLPKVAQLLKEAAANGGALERAMKTSASAQNRFMNAWEGFLKSVFESGVDEGLAVFFDTLTKALQILEPVVKKIGQAFRFMFVPLEGLMMLWKEMPTTLKVLTAGFLAFTAAIFGWTTVMKAAAVVLKPMFIMLTLLFLLLEDLWVWSQGGESLIGDLGNALADLISPEIWDFFFKQIDWWIQKFIDVYNWIGKIKDRAMGVDGNPNSPEARARANAANKAFQDAQRGGGRQSPNPIPLGSITPSQNNTYHITIDGAKDPRAIVDEFERRVAGNLNATTQMGGVAV